jgi:SEFIR domain
LTDKANEGPAATPTALISWAHANTDWSPAEVAEWEQTIRTFVDLLRTNGIDVDVDLFHFSESATDWTRWGQEKVRTSDFVIVALSKAWAERWQGINAPHVGAGAVAEADALKGIFGRDQSEFQRKTLLALMPGISVDVVPPDLYRLNRFTLRELTREGIDDLLRMVFEAPECVPTPVGPRPNFRGLPATITAVSSAVPSHLATPFEASAESEYFERLIAVSDERSRHRRLGAGLTDHQVQAAAALRPRVPAALNFECGQTRILHGPLGSGKSDIAEEWHRAGIRRASSDPAAAVPVWITIDDLASALEPHVLAEVGLAVLRDRGVDVVVDGLDERAERGPGLMRQAGEFVKKWPRSRVVSTNRSPGLVAKELLVEAPPLSSQQAEQLMATVAGRNVRDVNLGPQLDAAVVRPLFALLIAQRISAVEGATGIHEVVARVVDDVVSREQYNLFSELRALAVETIRAGGAVDPATIAPADVAALIRRSPLVVTTGRKCAFALATFEQWFAAQAILDDVVGMDEALASMDTFDRWRYVLAIIAATGDAARADTVLAASARWNPGAAAWVVDEMQAGGLSRALPEVGPQDWEAFGQRIRTAMAAWLDGIGPLAECWGPSRSFNVGFDDLAVAANIQPPRVSIAWLPRSTHTDHPLARVVEMSALRKSPGFELSTVQLPTAANGIWQLTRDQIASGLSTYFTDIAHQIALSYPGVAREEARVYLAAKQALRDAPTGFTGNLDVERLYPAADIAPSPRYPFGGYSTEEMYRYSVAVIDAALRCYVELSEWVTPRFGRALPLLGMMPVEFFGSMFYTPDRERGPFEFPGPLEPGFSWMFRPLGSPSGYVITPADNRISLSLNDDARSDEMLADKTKLYTAYTDYIEAHPEYEPFARPFSSSHGRLDLFHETPATELALQWLRQDLDELGFLKR